MPSHLRVPPALLFSLLLLLAGSARARAQTPPTGVLPVPAPAAEPPPSPPGQTGAADLEADRPEKKKKKKKDESGLTPSAAVEAVGDRIELRGRVMAGAVYEDQELERELGGARTGQEALTLEVLSARFGIDARVFDWLTVVLEAELAGRVRLRDGFVEAEGKRWGVRAGQFKMPISVFTLESPWRLPLARRGWLHELLSDHLLISGRREGFMGTVKGGGGLDPELAVGAFRSVTWGPDAGDPVENLAPDEQTVTARLSVTPAGIEIAAVGQRRVTVVNQPKGYWAAGLESTADLEFERTGLRWWAEAYAGSSWLGFDADSTESVTFVTGRALVAYRFGGLERRSFYLEPFATVGVLEPDTDAIEDSFFEVMAGLNLGHWRSTRATLQFELGHAQRNFPRSYFLPYGRPFLARHRAVVLMVGAAF